MKKRLPALLLAFSIGAACAAETAPPAQGLTVKGEVLEVQDAGSYTYFRMKTATGETWAAVGKSALKKGEQVTIEDAIAMSDFQSRAMNRKFDRIVLGRLAGTPRAAVPEAAGGANAHTQVASVPNLNDVKVAKATGPDARTVAEIVTKRADLKDKPVLVRGKVVKFTPDIMGKNWVHLRDGTGSAAERTNDLLVTTSDTVAIGDVVTAKGVVRVDKDFGSGYAYQVLVDQAGLQKK